MLRRVGLLFLMGVSATPVLAQARLGPEFRVNSFTTFVQTTPDLAATPDGGFIVVWTSWNQVITGADVYAQRYDAAGNPVGGEFRVNSYTTSSQYGPSVAADADGNFVVVWDSVQDGDNFGVFGQRFDATGVRVGGEFRVNTYTTGTQADAAVAMDRAGKFVVAWRGGGTGDPSGVFARRYDENGAPQGNEVLANTFTLGQQGSPALASDANGNFVVVWDSLNQPPDAFNLGVFGQRFGSTGVKVGPEFLVNTYTTFGQGYPSVDADGEGRFVVVWRGLYDVGGTGNWGIFGQRFHADATKDGAEFAVNAFTTHDQRRPAVAVGVSGNFVVTWMSPLQDGSGYGVFGRHFRAAGVTPGAEFRVNAYTSSGQDYPAIAMHPNGTFMVAWDSFGRDGSSSGVFGQRFAIDHIFSDGFESSDMSAWSLASVDGVDLAVSGAAALAGTTMGLQGLVDDQAGLWVQDDSPSDERQYRARFYFDTNGFDPGEAQDRRRVRLFLGFDGNGNRRLFAVVLRRLSGAYGVMGRARRDDDSQADTGFFPVTDGAHWIELRWVAATAPGANNGAFTLWIDGILMTTVAGIDSDLGQLDFVRLGALSVKAGANGTLYWDEFESRRSTFIGP
jgi:hypothetical protein